VESLSTFAWQFIGQMEKPKVDFIGGLIPAIAIEQNPVSRNPRSTVATVTLRSMALIRMPGSGYIPERGPISAI